MNIMEAFYRQRYKKSPPVKYIRAPNRVSAIKLWRSRHGKDYVITKVKCIYRPTTGKLHFVEGNYKIRYRRRKR